MVIKTAEITEIREKRIQLLIALWRYLVETENFSESKLTLSYPDIIKIAEHYCKDYVILKYRYRIKKRIERAKIAGLMTSLIVRYRPIHLIAEEYETRQAFYANEILAIYYGLATSYDDSLDKVADLIDNKWFIKWFEEFQFLLHERHHTPESLIFIYKTLISAINNKGNSSAIKK